MLTSVDFQVLKFLLLQLQLLQLNPELVIVDNEAPLPRSMASKFKKTEQVKEVKEVEVQPTKQPEVLKPIVPVEVIRNY